MPRLRRYALWTLVFAAGALFVLGVIGCFRYTSVGLDFQWPRDDGRVYERYARLRWYAGSVWIGYGDEIHPATAATPEWFDPAATFFRAGRNVESTSIWNQIGFRLDDFTGDPNADVDRPRRTVRSRFVAVPWWLPSVALLIWPTIALLRRRRGRRLPADRATPPSG